MISIVLEEEGPELTDSLLELANRSFPVPLPDSYISLLRTIGNGGHPTEIISFPVVGLEGDEYLVFHGLYGLFHWKNVYNLHHHTWELSADLMSRFLPIGFDDVGGSLLLFTDAAYKGQIRYLESETGMLEATEKNTYLIASSVREFLDSLKVLEE